MIIRSLIAIATVSIWVPVQSLQAADVKSSEVISPAPIITPATVTGYLLGPNDLIEIKVYQEDDLTFRGRIAADGTINMPMLGKIVLGNGQTVESARAYIEKVLRDEYLVNPQVSLSILEYARRKYTVMGKVGKVGTYDIPGDERLTIVDAIAAAGGMAESANDKRVLVTRTVNGQKTTIKLNVKDMMTDPRTKSFEILPGDLIVVGEAIF